MADRASTRLARPSGNSARGSALVAYRVASNPDEAARSGTLRIENTSVSITQSGIVPCTYDVTPADRTFDAGVG